MISLSHLNKLIFFAIFSIILILNSSFAEDEPADIWKQEKIANEQVKKNRKVKIFIQINIGNEKQKNGIEIQNLESFYKKCIDDFNLKIIGIMCIPLNDNLSVYFSKMRELSDNFKLPELSMGMSNDYLKACEYKTTFLRIGSKIFGSRI